MMITFDFKVEGIQEASKEAVKLAKDLLSGDMEMTPYSIAKFSLMAGYPDVEVFAHSSGKDPFNDVDEYEENVFYYHYETGEVTRVTFHELERLIRTFVEYEIERGLYIHENEKQEFEVLLKELG